MTGSGMRPLDRLAVSKASGPLPKHSSLPKGTSTCPNKKNKRAPSWRSSISGQSPRSLVRSLPARPTRKTGNPPSSGSRKPSGRKCWTATETARPRGRASQFRSGEESTSDELGRLAGGKRAGLPALLFFARKEILSRAGEMHGNGISPAPGFPYRCRRLIRPSVCFCCLADVLVV
jgi:hypothetical protein